MKNSNKEKKSYRVRPSIFGACMEITGRAPTAAALLMHMALRANDKTLTDEYGEKGWLAMTAHQWTVLTGMTSHQYEGALAKLKKLSLIEARRRRLSWKHSAAITWTRMPQNVISDIDDIMSREAVPAFTEVTETEPEISENTEDIISQNAEIVNPTSSGKAGSLNINEIVINEIVSNEMNSNVIAKKTAINIDGPLKKKGILGKVNRDKGWYKMEMRKMYYSSQYTPEPFTETNLDRLTDIVEYLESDPANFHEYCPQYEDPAIYALKIVVEGWPHFSSYAEEYYKGYNLPEHPTLWSFAHQTRVIPDFVKIAYICGLITNVRQKSNLPPPEFSVAVSFYLGTKMKDKQTIELEIINSKGCDFLSANEKEAMDIQKVKEAIKFKTK